MSGAVLNDGTSVLGAAEAPSGDVEKNEQDDVHNVLPDTGKDDKDSEGTDEAVSTQKSTPKTEAKKSTKKEN